MKNLKIRTLLIITFLSISLIPLFILGYTVNSNTFPEDAFWSIIAITTVFAILAAIYIAKAITNPIDDLIGKANKIALGDLDISQCFQVYTVNEFRALSESFNLLTERLENHIKKQNIYEKIKSQEKEEKDTNISEFLHKLEILQERLVAQEKLASLGLLTAGIVHEIKNPLNFINNFAQLCEKQTGKMQDFFAAFSERLNKEEGEDLNKIITTINSNVKKIREHGLKANSIINNMLEHSRSDAPKNYKPTNINALLEEHFKLAYHAKRSQDSSFNIQMEMNFEKNLGDIDILPLEIGRVTLNMLNNAFYAISEKMKTAPNDYFPLVAITTKKEAEDKISISFYDNGIGIPQEVGEKIYNSFYTTKPPGEGTGLGLALSRDIILDAHHGEIHVESKIGEFTIFTIILPCKQTVQEKL